MEVVRTLVRALRREARTGAPGGLAAAVADDLTAFLLLEPRLWVYRPLDDQSVFAAHLRTLAVDEVRAFSASLSLARVPMHDARDTRCLTMAAPHEWAHS
jgi:hypothetical protein